MLDTLRISVITGSLLLLVLISGCGKSAGPKRVAIRGAILFNNQPLEAGRIHFTPVEGSRGPTAVATVTKGFYDFDARTGPVVGKHKVRIESIVDPGFELDDEAAFAKSAKQQAGRPVLPPQPVPPQYNERTTLVVNVSAEGETKFDFSL